jgi:hypothetical protein
MACHYATVGHTTPRVGRFYVRSLQYTRERWRLQSFNTATGTATLIGFRVCYISLTELSHWHQVEC